MNYKKHKYKINKLNLNVILKQNVFIAVFQIKFLNASDWISLKKLTSNSNLKLFICKHTYFKNNVSMKNIIKHNSLHNGNILILYSNEPLLFSLKQDIFVKNKNIILLYFYLYNRLLLPRNYIPLVESFSKVGVIQLISLLEFRKTEFLNNMLVFHNFLTNLKY